MALTLTLTSPHHGTATTACARRFGAHYRLSAEALASARRRLGCPPGCPCGGALGPIVSDDGQERAFSPTARGTWGEGLSCPAGEVRCVVPLGEAARATRQQQGVLRLRLVLRQGGEAVVRRRVCPDCLQWRYGVVLTAEEQGLLGDREQREA